MTSIIDTHVHLWDPGRLPYPWLGDIPVLNRPYGLGEYRQACGGHDVTRMVFVQCDTPRTLEEAAWVSELAKEDPRLAAIVAGAAIEKGEAVLPDLEQLVRYPLVRGVRRLIQSEPMPGFCTQPNFIAGLKLLPRFNFSFDICIKHHQLGDVIDMVRQCPQVTFILDHIAKPDIAKQLFEPWRRQIRELAGLPNVWCKVSGMVTEADHQKWTAADLKPYVEHVLDCFGADRVMFGGDWPVVALASPLHRWIDTLKDLISACSMAEQTKLFHDNARRCYRLA